MKKIIIAISALAVLLMSSCTKDFVTVQHNSTEPMDSYFIDESRMYESLVAAYHPLQWFDYAFGAYNDLRLVSDIMADDIYCGGSNEGDQPTLVYTHYYKATAIDHCGGIWTTAYSGVNRSCVVLEYVDGVPGMSEATKQLYKAEATILKAWYYTVLWKFWGNIPYYDVNLTAPYTAPQLTADEVYNNIVTKIEEALQMNVLPTTPSAKGRITKDMAYMLYAEVMRENAYLSRTIEIQDGQKVVDTGLYGIVRHPMYMATILLFLMIPLVLGSWYALIAFAFYPAIIVVRLKDEEALLTRELSGYAEYKQKVKYRIIPFIW